MISSATMQSVNQSLARGLLQWSMVYLTLDRQAARLQNPGRDTFNESILLQTLPEKTRRSLVHDGMELYRMLPLENELGNRRQMMEAALRQAAIQLHKEDPGQAAHLEMWEMFRFRHFREQILAEERQKKENPKLLSMGDLTPFERQSIIDRYHALKDISFQRAGSGEKIAAFPDQRVVNCT